MCYFLDIFTFDYKCLPQKRFNNIGAVICSNSNPLFTLEFVLQKHIEHKFAYYGFVGDFRCKFSASNPLENSILLSVKEVLTHSI